jgi:UDP-N-acetylglucosamine 2-epimerase (non-hydrolysing)
VPGRRLIVPRVAVLFGTRPEVIKFAPVLWALEAFSSTIETLRIASAQHSHLLYPFTKLFGIGIDRNLEVMRENQTPEEVFARVLTALGPVLKQESPDLLLVQGDTTTATAGAMAAFNQRIPVGHIEAGLRSGNKYSPFPEEMNRRLITRLASYHFAATENNRNTLLFEGVADDSIFVTGNPVVDALESMMRTRRKSPELQRLLSKTAGLKRILLTTHRRESQGAVMARNLVELSQFVKCYEDVVLIFPVHLNPAVKHVAQLVLAGQPRVFLEEPLGYEDFVGLATESWLLVSDSGGVQEEAPSLGKPILILRENTERPEGIQAGVAKLVGGRAGRLRELLEEAYAEGSWAERVQEIGNPFGDGSAGRRIAAIVARLLGVDTSTLEEQSLRGENHRCPLPS